MDIARSSYLALMWDKTTGRYQLFKFPLTLPDSSELNWYFTNTGKGHLNGTTRQADACLSGTANPVDN